MDIISNNVTHKQKTKDYFISKQLDKSGIKNTVKNGVITIKNEISDSDLEELKYVFEQYKIIK